MNNAKMWLVVPPAVGVPVFLGAVAVGSFAVHVAVLSKTNWYEDFLLGNPLGSSAAAQAEAALTIEGDAATAKASYVAPTPEGDRVTVILPDGTTATAILQAPEVLASADDRARLALE
ncbi:MAG: light-harvesting protein [Paracoccaceae bacterium]|jgi:light-harvesting protein B-800-850 alpha chain|nr:light-harvesting protein [Paracoccaceae bacterium]